MASGWKTVRDQINTTLEGSPLELRRVKKGLADFAGQPLTEAGNTLYQKGFFVMPNGLQKGPLMERSSKHREMFCEIYTGISVGADFDVALDELTERVEKIIELLHDTAANVPGSRMVELSGQAIYQVDQESFEQVYVRIPLRVEYQMP